MATYCVCDKCGLQIRENNEIIDLGTILKIIEFEKEINICDGCVKEIINNIKCTINIIFESNRKFKITQYELAFRILKKSNYSMKTPEIAKQMIALGYPKRYNKSFLNSVYTALKNDFRIQKIGFGLWELVDSEKDQ